MEFKIKDAALLKTLVSSLKVMSDEVTLKFSEAGLSARVMDPSRVAMIDLEVSKAVFETWVPGNTARIGVNLIEFEKVLRRSNTKDDSITVALDEKTGKLQVKIFGKYARDFTMPTLGSDEEDVPLPKLSSFNTAAKFQTSLIKQALEDAQLVSDHLKISSSKDGIRIDAAGDLMTANINMDKDALLNIEMKEESKATYSLSYMMEILATAQSLTDVGVLEFSTDMPIKLSFQKDDAVKVAFYLAPRIETE